jgi:hypothetical protein
VLVQLLVLLGFAIAAVALVAAATYEWIVRPWSTMIMRDLADAADRLRAEFRTEMRAGFNALSAELHGSTAARATQAEDDHVRRTRVQFDVEYAAMQGVWTRVSEVRARMGELHTVVADRTAQTQADREKTLHDRADAFRRAFDDLETFADDHDPFLPPTIRQPLDRLLTMGREERAERQAPGRRDPAATAAGMNRRVRFGDGSTEIAAAIRDYVSRVVVVP